MRVCVFLPDGGGGGVSSHSHPVLPLCDLLGPVWMQPGHTGHMARIHHGHDPVLYTQLTEKHTQIIEESTNGHLLSTGNLK